MNKTLNNLMEAFNWESQARNRYTMYAKIAKKEWFDQVWEIFQITADNEREHAKWIFRMIQEIKWDLTEHSINAWWDLTLWNTIENLKSAINGEHHEHSSMYPEFSEMAIEEWLPEIAERLKAIWKAEIHHEERYLKILNELENNTLFNKQKPKERFCRKCWYMHKWEKPPQKCPSCDHAYNYFQLKLEQY